MEAEVLRLHHAEKWPIGTIARQLRLHHSTVSRDNQGDKARQSG
jgi:IS30 family transposase